MFNVDFGPLMSFGTGAGTEVAPIGATRGEGGDHLWAMRAMAAMTRSEPWAMVDMDRSEIVKWNGPNENQWEGNDNFYWIL